MSHTIAIFPGSFDPFTRGHQALVDDALRIFDKVVIGIGNNVSKAGLLRIEARKQLIEDLYADNPRVEVRIYTADRLQTFFDGNLWIITRRKKTNTESNIRLLDVPKRIIEKYKGLARDGHVFPVPSNGSCNKILKEIGRQCGFKVRLTYHVARHTNATTVLLSHGVPIETVSRLLGHTNIKTTQIYAKITAQKISQDMETLSHKLEDMEKNICRAI